MGFKTQGQQSTATGYSAKRAVIGKCGTPSSTQCITSTLTGTTPQSPPQSPPGPTIYFTINNMTSTQITYTITNILNSDGTTSVTSYTFPTNCGLEVYLNVGNATSGYSTPYFNFPNPITSSSINTPITANYNYLEPSSVQVSQLPSGNYPIDFSYYYYYPCQNVVLSNIYTYTV
jgi:hypothetical protein